MDNFLTIVEHIVESNTGDSTRDIFKTAVQVYEDEHGDITDAEADQFYILFTAHMEVA